MGALEQVIGFAVHGVGGVQPCQPEIGMHFLWIKLLCRKVTNFGIGHFTAPKLKITLCCQQRRCIGLLGQRGVGGVERFINLLLVQHGPYESN